MHKNSMQGESSLNDSDSIFSQILIDKPLMN